MKNILLTLLIPLLFACEKNFLGTQADTRHGYETGTVNGELFLHPIDLIISIDRVVVKRYDVVNGELVIANKGIIRKDQFTINDNEVIFSDPLRWEYLGSEYMTEKWVLQ